ISNYNWRSAYYMVGIGTIVLLVTASFFLKRDPQQIGQLPYGMKKQTTAVQGRRFDFHEVVHTRQFWMVCGIYFCFGYCLHTLMVHIVPHAIKLGIPPANAATILVAIGGTTIIAKVLAGIASDRAGAKPTIVVGLIILTGGLIWLQGTDTLRGLFIFGIIFGISYGGVMTMQSLLLAELFGVGSLGVIVGGVTFIYTIGSATGPLLAGQIFDVTGSYRLAFIICIIPAVAGIILTLLVKPVKDKRQGM
ncbi:MFS transporter, partial [Chloroflexota bacterium]